MIVEKADKSDIPDIDKKKCVWWYKEREIIFFFFLSQQLSPCFLCSLFLPSFHSPQKNRYLVPSDLTVGHFSYVIRKRIKVREKKEGRGERER